MISRYNVATGTANTDTEGYHHTVTVASLRAAAFWLGRHDADAPLHEVLQAIMNAEEGKAAWLLLYWRKATLFSPVARRRWVAPDVMMLPF
ncbi:hypothetical protein AA103196_1630 [Ameyamaea chiangmaiensis NBRC 103196]|uniref:hypothetical protein n=1 Tax=Ameyamaea chiangmaiensis TaxID=442969 RepID=UPI001C4007BE|nr:hypothetical protein [Ameyamaea chiangmaiensis]GBQ67223.1 hypothetical protein AA103196_1630 [Ameyamaea chiangmaiensis NBRC 103196]